MSANIVRRGILRGLALGLLTLIGTAVWAGGGALDAPESHEPRVAVATSTTKGGLVASQGLFQPFERVDQKATLYSRDLLVALPGFTVNLQPASKAVELSLRGNMPGLSDSPVLESSVILHDTRAYDLDFTYRSGRIVITNKKAKGAARIWMRAVKGAVALTLPEPGDSIALELFGRWPAGVPFALKNRKAGDEPVQLWQAWVLKGSLDIKAAKTTWSMSAAPGKNYFHGNSTTGPNSEGPERVKKLPDWADPNAKPPETAKLVEAVIKEYATKLKTKDAEEAAKELLAATEKDKNKKRATVARELIVFAMMATDNVEKVAELLNTSKHSEIRKTAVIALRHWIGVRKGRDDILYEMLIEDLNFSKIEAESFMQLLHSPFDAKQSETFETLIAYLRHRKQGIRELAHWHLVRLAPVGRDIKYNAAGTDAELLKAYKAWKAKVPSGELPPEPKDETKDKDKGGKKKAG